MNGGAMEKKEKRKPAVFPLHLTLSDRYGYKFDLEEENALKALCLELRNTDLEGQALSDAIEEAASKLFAGHQDLPDVMSAVRAHLHGDVLASRLSAILSHTPRKKPSQRTEEILSSIDLSDYGYMAEGDEIKVYALKNESRKELVIPNGVTEIEEKAFMRCKEIECVRIPSSVKKIGGSAFAGCSSLREITVSENNPYYESINGILYFKGGERALVSFPQGKLLGTRLIIPDGVTKICEGACSGAWVYTIEIPASVTSIGQNAFRGIEFVRRIEIPASVTYIGPNAFSDCGRLEAIEADPANPNYKSIDGSLYSKDGKTLIQYAVGSKKEDVFIPEGVTSISADAFSGCKIPKKVTLPSSLTSIGKAAFRGCFGLISVEIPLSVTEIEERAFEECQHLSDIVIPESVTSVGKKAFSCCFSLRNITVPKSVEYMDEKVFEDCRDLLIFCECEKPEFSLPAGWDENWVILVESTIEVVWGKKNTQ